LTVKKAKTSWCRNWGFTTGTFAILKKGAIKNPDKLLFALSSKGISPDWFLTGNGPMLKPQEPEGYGTKAQGAVIDNSVIPASPPVGAEGYRGDGMTLRDYFAGKALAGLLADSDGFVVDDKASFDFIAKKSFEYADAMLAQRGAAS
jgi:hypothetical protein